MDYYKQLGQNLTRLQKLKANIYVWTLQSYIADLKEQWQPQTKTVEAETLYFDEYHQVWTDRETAFRGHVFINVNKRFQK